MDWFCFEQEIEEEVSTVGDGGSNDDENGDNPELLEEAPTKVNKALVIPPTNHMVTGIIMVMPPC